MDDLYCSACGEECELQYEDFGVTWSQPLRLCVSRCCFASVTDAKGGDFIPNEDDGNANF